MTSVIPGSARIESDTLHLNRRIMMICGSWPPIKCGVGDFSYKLAVEMAKQGNQVSVITDRSAQKSTTEDVHVLPIVDLWGFSSLPKVLSAVEKMGPDCINLQYPTICYPRLSLVDFLPISIRWRLQTPIVTTIHEYSTFQTLGRLRIQLLARSSTAVIVTEAQNRDLLTASLPKRADRIHHVPIGSNIDLDLPAHFDRALWRQAHGLSSDTLMVVYFGFISPSKGVDKLLEAVSLLPETLRIQLWLLADKEPSAPQYLNYHSGVAQQVDVLAKSIPLQWTGYLPAESISPYLAAADLAVLPFTDGASLRRTTLLACIAHGLPVLSTGSQAPIGGVDVVPIGDAAALARAISAFHMQPAKLAQLRRQAEDAARQISWPSIAQETIDFLAKVAT